MELKPGYKQTEIGVIPEDWDVKEIGEVALVSRGAGSQLIEYTNCIGIRFIRINDFFEDKPVYVKPTDVIMKYDIRSTDILFAGTGESAGASYLPPKDWVGLPHSYNAPRIRIKPEYVTKFIAHSLKANYVTAQQDKFFVGAAQHFLDITAISKLKIALPLHNKEQINIVTSIDDIDSLITSLEKLIEKKKNIKQGVMQELLTGKRRLPGFTGKWETKKLGELANLYQPQTISQDVFTDGGYNVWGANGIIGKFNKYNHKNWQTTISCRGNCGSVNKTDHPCWITGNAMVVNVDNNQCINKLFLYYKLSSLDFSDLITGSGQPQIVRGPLSIYNLDLPILVEEQKAIASILHCMDKDIAINTEKLFKYQKLKQGIMQELLTGRIRLV